jgi:hypothetical protein
MSEKSIPLIIAVATIALMFGWLQVINFAFPHWHRALKRRRMKNLRRDRRGRVSNHPKIPAQAVPLSSLSSRRLADKSRDLREAIYAREERGASRSQPATPHISLDSKRTNCRL